MRTGDGKPFELGNRLELNGCIIETSAETHEIDVVTEVQGMPELPEPVYCIGRKGTGVYTDLLRFTQPDTEER